MEKPPMGGDSADSLYGYGLFCFAFLNSEMLVVNIFVDFIPLEKNAPHTTHLLLLLFNNTIKDPLFGVHCKPHQAKKRALQKLTIILRE